MATSHANELAAYLKPTCYVDSEHPDIVAYAQRVTAGLTTDVDKAVALYYAVRDDVRYDPYAFTLGGDTFVASHVLKTGRAFCVPKAILLAAVGRAVGIPTRMGFADVRNHLTSERLSQLMGTDVFAFHGNTGFYLEGQWVKCTPAFNLSLCEKAGVIPLDFNGRDDSLFHPYDRSGKQHMEYLKYHGDFADFPLDRLINSYKDTYPNMFKRLDARALGLTKPLGNFEDEVTPQAH